jgi:hypothetical protein
VPETTDPLYPTELHPATTTRPERPSGPQPSDRKAVAAVRRLLGTPLWEPRPELGEKPTRRFLWSQRELNDFYERHGGTVTARPVQPDTPDAQPVMEITVTVPVDEVGAVELVTEWDGDWEQDAGRSGLPLVRALTGCPA